MLPQEGSNYEAIYQHQQLELQERNKFTLCHYDLYRVYHVIYMLKHMLVNKNFQTQLLIVWWRYVLKRFMM